MRCLRQIIYCRAGRQLVGCKKGGIRPESAEVSSRWKPALCRSQELMEESCQPVQLHQITMSRPLHQAHWMPSPDNQKLASPDTWCTGDLHQIPRGWVHQIGPQRIPTFTRKPSRVIHQTTGSCNQEAFEASTHKLSTCQMT